MLSWIFTTRTFPDFSPHTFSAAGTDFINLPNIDHNGNLRSETSQQAVYTHVTKGHNRQDERYKANTADKRQWRTRQHSTTLFDRDYYDPDNTDIRPRWLRSSEGSLQKKVIHSLNQEPLPLAKQGYQGQEEVKLCVHPQLLYGTFNANNGCRYTREQRGGSAAQYYPACSGDDSDDAATWCGSGADARQRGYGFWRAADGSTSGVERQVPRRRREESAAGRPFVCARIAGRGEEEAEVREWTSSEDKGIPSLDGAQDEGEGYVKSKAAKGASSVRDRVAALEAKDRKVVTPSGPKKSGDKAAEPGGAAKPNVPSVYPLHYKRFQRRTSSGTPVKPETPLYRSLPDDEPSIHAPKPRKSIPTLNSPPETPMPKKYTSNRVTPPCFLYGTKSNCVRHGRKRVTRPNDEPATTAKDMLAKTRSGAYDPTGLPARRQMEATSPWAVPSKSPMKTEHAKSGSGSDACPDCVSELNIKRHELQKGTEATVKRPTDTLRRTTTSMSAEPATSLKRQSLLTQGAGNTPQGDENGDLVCARELPTGIDAMIVEQGGNLRRLIINAQNREASIVTMQRLSRELAQLANSMAFASSAPRSVMPANPSAVNDSVVAALAQQNARNPSIPTLLHMIDQAASEIHTHTGKIAEHYVSPRDGLEETRHSLLSGSDFDDVIGSEQWTPQGMATRQALPAEYFTLYKHLANGASKESVKTATNTPAAYRPNQAAETQPANTRTPIQQPQTATPSRNMPKIMMTRPTLPPAMPRMREEPPTDTPPPAHPAIHHDDGWVDNPNAALTPKPDGSQHHSLFSSLNPFNFHKAPARTPQPSAPASPMTPAAVPTVPTFPDSIPNRQDEDSPSGTPSGIPPMITTQSNPYHHAPHTPLDINTAAFNDPKLREQQQVIRSAMRMEKNKAVQEAAAIERDVRRKKSLPGLVRKGLFG